MFLCFPRSRYQVSVYRTTGPLVFASALECQMFDDVSTDVCVYYLKFGLGCCLFVCLG